MIIASISEITDANLKRLQESLSGPTSKRPSSTSKSSFPPSASSSFQQPHNASVQNSARIGSQPAQQHQHTEQLKGNCEVDDYEVDALIPPVPSTFLELDHMTLSEVKEIMDDKMLLKSFTLSTSGVKTLEELKQSIETANVNAAKANLKHEGEIDKICTELKTLKHNLDSKMQQYRKLDDERNAITNPPDLQEAIRELTMAKKDAYRESEELADGWVESGGENVSDFVKEFMEVRLLYHTRAAKAERLEMSM